MGTGSPEIRTALCRRFACPVAHGVVVPLEMGVPVAILGQIMVFRWLQARNTPPDSDCVSRRSVGRLPDDVLCVELTAWRKTIANTGPASSTTSGM